MVTAVAPVVLSRAESATAKAAPAPTNGGAIGAYAAVQASPAPEPTTPPPPVAEQLSNAILARMDVSAGGGRIDFHLRLDPPELGQVRVQLTMMQQTLSARLVAHDQSTCQLIQSQMDTLRQRLQETGLSLGQFDVSGGGGQGGGQRQQPWLPFPDLGGDAALMPAATPQREVTVRIVTGGIDLVA
jgi:flagellar hook-length control protein FliK